MRLDVFDFVEVENSPFGNVTLIGMMEDGPTGVPFKLLEGADATFLLGDNEVSRAYNLLFNNGVPRENIILLRLNGQPSKFRLDILEGIGINLQSLTSNEADNNIGFTISTGGIGIYSNYSDELVDSKKRKQFQRVYSFDDYQFTSDLTEAITKDAVLGYHNVIASYDEALPTPVMALYQGEYFFDGGASESQLVSRDGERNRVDRNYIEKEEDFLEAYWERFHYHLLGNDFDGETSNKLSEIKTEVIYFPDVLIDKMPELAILGGRIAKERTESQDVLATSLFRTSLILREEDEDDELKNSKIDEYVDKISSLFTIEEQLFPEMKNVQIVIGEELSISGDTIPASSHYLLRLISGDLNPLTNKELESFYQIRTPLEKNAIEKLSNKGYICTMESIRKNIVTSKVQNMYSSDRFKDSFYYNKILSYITHDVRDMLDSSFIGQNISLYNISDIEYRLNEYLQQYIDARLISSFSLGERVDDSVGYSSNIGIDIVMFGEVEGIKGSLKLNESGWEVNLWNLMD